MSTRRNLVLVVAAFMASTGAANASIIAMDQEFGPFGARPLILNDGQWVQGFDGINGGGDFGISPSGNSIWIKETWGGTPGSVVDLDTFVEPDPNIDAIFPIDINKVVNNASGIFWNAFEIRLIPTGGTINSVTANTNAFFDTVTITQDGDDFIIFFEQGSGLGGTLGDDIPFQFSFNYKGDIIEGINFRILQTAIPTPGTLGLLAVAGLAAARRRR